MAGIPTGWTYSTIVAGGATAKIIVPAGLGNVINVLTHLSATVEALPGAGVFNPTIQVLDGVTVLRSFSLMVNAPAGQRDGDSLDTGEIAIMGSALSTLTVQFAAVTPAAMTAYLLINGYPQ